MNLHLRSQRGVGLIEVMVAVLVLSIGFLGVGALIARSMATNNSAMGRSMATIASYSILDAMRADKSQAVAGAYNTTSVKGSTCPANPSSSSLAAYQLDKWCYELRDDLGESSSTTGAVNCDGSGVCTVTVQFQENPARSGSVSSTQTVVTKAML